MKNKLWIALGVVIILIIISLTHHTIKLAKSSAAEAIILNSSDISYSKLGVLNEIIPFTGDLRPKTSTIISSEVDAKVIDVLVDEGESVVINQVLAKLDTSDLKEMVSQQKATLTRSKAQLDLDYQKMKRQGELLKQGFISKIGFDELVNNYQASLQNYKAQEAVLKRSQKQLADATIKAPFSGIIYQKSIEPGQLARQNTQLFSLANLSMLEVKAAIPSNQINLIQAGQKVNFQVENITTNYEAIVSRVNQVAEEGSRSFMVYITFDNQAAKLKAGQFVKGNIVLKKIANQVIIPCAAIRGDSQVLIVDKNQVKIQKIQIKLRNNVDNLCAVTGILKHQMLINGNVVAIKAKDKVKILN